MRPDVLRLIRKAVRESVNTARVVRSIFVQFPIGDPLPEVRHLNYSFRKAISEVNVNRQINALSKERYFENRVVMIAGLPKSGSSFIGECASVIYSAQRKKTHGQYFNSGNIDLTPELVAGRFCREGGVLKDHIRASNNNREILDFLGVKHIVVVRHPADQVVAAYCHLLGTNEGSVVETLTDDGYFEGNFYPVHKSCIDPEVSIDSAIHHMICDGYLKATLTWMVDWFRLRNHEKSLVVKYEDFKRNATDTLGQMSRFLRAVDLDEQIMADCISVAGARSDSPETKNARQYPNGWTGGIGAWERYFSSENKAEYVKTVSEFIDSHPDSSLLSEVYPDICDLGS